MHTWWSQIGRAKRKQTPLWIRLKYPFSRFQSFSADGSPRKWVEAKVPVTTCSIIPATCKHIFLLFCCLCQPHLPHFFALGQKSRSRNGPIANRQPHQSSNPTTLVPPRYHIQNEDVRRQLLGTEDLPWKGTNFSRGREPRVMPMDRGRSDCCKRRVKMNERS